MSMYAAHMTGLNQYTESRRNDAGFMILSRRAMCAFSCAIMYPASRSPTPNGRNISGRNIPKVNGAFTRSLCLMLSRRRTAVRVLLLSIAQLTDA